MIRKALFGAVLIACALNVYAQTETPKKIDQFVGVQVNQLFRQIINLNSSNTNNNNNSYLLTYSINLAKQGWGISVGTGYTYQEITDKNSPANHQSKINDLFYRAGLERKVLIGKKF